MLERVWRNPVPEGALLHCWWECKLVQPLWRTVWTSLKKLRTRYHMIQQSHSLASIWRKNWFIRMFIAALYTVAKTWKQSKCSSTKKWIKKLYTRIYTYICIYICKGIFSSVQSLSRVRLFATPWIAARQDSAIKNNNKTHLQQHGSPRDLRSV